MCCILLVTACPIPVLNIAILWWIVAAYLGANLDLALVWSLADCANALMAFPNLVSLILLSGVIIKETNKYLWGNRLDEYSNEEPPVIED